MSKEDLEIRVAEMKKDAEFLRAVIDVFHKKHQYFFVSIKANTCLIAEDDEQGEYSTRMEINGYIELITPHAKVLGLDNRIGAIEF